MTSSETRSVGSEVSPGWSEAEPWVALISCTQAGFNRRHSYAKARARASFQRFTEEAGPVLLQPVQRARQSVLSDFAKNVS